MTSDPRLKRGFAAALPAGPRNTGGFAAMPTLPASR
jgi:hypothetical protein